jgi:hypothetical protein
VAAREQVAVPTQLAAQDEPGGVLGTGEVQAARWDYVADHNIVGPGRAWRCRMIKSG